MKKLFILSILLATVAVMAPSVEAKSPGAISLQERIAYLGPPVQRYQRRGRRVVTRTRITRVGRYRYRETIRVTYFPNGRTRTQVISRVRLVGGRRW